MRIIVFMIFISVLTLILFIGHKYAWMRLIRDTSLSPRKRKIATGLIVALGVMIPASMFLSKMSPRGPLSFISPIALTWMGALLYIVLVFAVSDSARWLKKKFTHSPAVQPKNPEAENEPVDKERRIFLARATAGVALAASGGAVFIGRSNVSGEISTPTIEVSLQRLPKALDGFRIVQLTDVHIGPILDDRFIRAIVEKTNALKPDMVVITGDLVDNTPKIIGQEVALLMNLKSRYGTYFVTGNHEYYSDAPAWIAHLQQMDVKVLMNERIRIGDASASFDLAGIPDTGAAGFIPDHAPNLAQTMAGQDPERELILLAHRPNPVVEAAKYGVGLQLSGHTHGGQMWPITLISDLIHPYNAGLHQHNDQTQIYVSRGTGFWGPPMRISAPAEITSIILKSG